MLDNQFFNIPYKNKWSRLLGEMGLGLNNDINETVRKFLTARLEVRYLGCDIIQWLILAIDEGSGDKEESC